MATIPLWLRLAYTLFVATLVPVYWRLAGPQNFLWFSDIALLVTVVTLWTRSALLASICAVSVLAIETVWAIDFLGSVILGGRLLGLTAYLHDPLIPLVLRVYSVAFHLILLALLPWLVWRLGYDRRALKVQTLVCWLVLPASRLFSTPAQNVNWSHGIGRSAQTFVPDAVWVLLLMALIPLLIYWPSHWLFTRVFRPAAAPHDSA